MVHFYVCYVCYLCYFLLCIVALLALGVDERLYEVGGALYL